MITEVLFAIFGHFQLIFLTEIEKQFLGRHEVEAHIKAKKRRIVSVLTCSDFQRTKVADTGLSQMLFLRWLGLRPEMASTKRCVFTGNAQVIIELIGKD